MGYAQIAAMFLKNWYWFVIVLFAILIAGLCLSLKVSRNANNELSEDNARLSGNVQSLVNDTNEYAQTVKFQRNELKNLPIVKAELKRMANELGVKDRDISRLHTIIAKSQFVDSVYITKTVYIDPSTGLTEIFHNLPIQWGCAQGVAEWMEGDSMALVTGSSELSLLVATYREKNKGYAWEDFKKFWAFRWKQLGQTKWNYHTKIFNRCDSSMIWNRNVIFEEIK